jgi:hypothetical protein
MIPLKLKRRYLRAPMNNECLYKDQDFMSRAYVYNISEGGILLGKLESLPSGEQFTIFLEVPQLPDFTKLSTNELMMTGSESLEREVVGTIVETRRSQKKEDSGLYELGCEFVDIRREAQEKISEYVRNFSVNTVFSLTLFEQGTHREEVKSLIRQCSKLLSYEKNLSMAKIREQLLHDYQSLESL